MASNAPRSDEMELDCLWPLFEGRYGSDAQSVSRGVRDAGKTIEERTSQGRCLHISSPLLFAPLFLEKTHIFIYVYTPR
eukprot:4532989-Pyramimonas_sp.AAC.1